jgi:hypothetical protein
MSGKNSRQYQSEYYIKNKKRINARNKKKYQLDRENPEKLKEIRERCTNHTRTYRAKHPEKVKTSRAKQYQDRKKRAMDMVGGAVCVNCQCDEISFLEFNHKNGGGSKEWRETGRNIMDRILKGDRHIDDLNILCRVCNALEHLKTKESNSAKRFQVVWQ